MRFITLIFILILAGSATISGQKPILPDFHADPSAHYWDGKYWIYPSTDEPGSTTWKQMRRWHCYSSVDLVDWKNEGEIFGLDKISWADSAAFAPDAVKWKGKYYFFFPAGFKIGVAVADNPAGPYKDALGKPLIEERVVKGVASFDPSIFIDDDGTPWLFYGGGGGCAAVKLKHNLTELDGEIIKLELEGYGEGIWVHKRNGIYYFTYPKHIKRDGKIKQLLVCSTAPTPTGPFTYHGPFLDNDSRNSHHSTIKIREKWYLFYHIEGPSPYERRVCVEYLDYNPDGTIREVKMTKDGIKSLDPPAGDHYEPEWESLLNYRAPEWYEDAKLGFWPIWGIYSVPAYMGDHAAEWYGRWMYCKKGQSSRNDQGLATHLHHIEKYGNPSEFGYKDFLPMFTAEKFDADEWTALAEQMGAKYFCTLGIFHDGFSMGKSNLTRWTAVNMGPQRDVVGELARSARKRGLKYGVSNHLAWNPIFYQWNHINGHDATDPANRDLYGTPFIQPGADTMRMKPGETRNSWENRSRGAVTPSPRDLDRWLARTKEMADLYRPDLYYFDWGMNPPLYESRRKEFAAHYYNRAVEWEKGKFGDPNVVLNYKNRRTFPPGAGVLDFERGSNDEIAEMVWQTDDCIYDGHNWGYAEGIPIKPVNRIVDEFVEIVSKRGVLMLAVAPKADGSFPEDQKQFIKEMGEWMDACGEAIYATRPWIKAVENAAILNTGNPGTVRTCFTRSKDRTTLYATMLEWPGSEILISSVNTGVVAADLIESVSLIGSLKKIKWSIDENGLKINVSKNKPMHKFAYPVKVKLKEATL